MNLGPKPIPSALRSPRLHRLLVFALAVVSAWWLVLADSRWWFGGFPKVPDPVDFTIYYEAARIGVEQGWSHIYDYQLQAQQFARFHEPAKHIDWSTLYITPPPMAWLISPLTLLPLALAYYLWVGVLFLGYLVAGYLTVPGRHLTRWAVVLFGATTYPVLQGLHDGQAAVLIVLGMLAGWALLGREHRILAGLVMAPIVLKPQTAYLVPLAILVWGEFRMFVAFSLGCVALGVLSAVSLGPDGLTHWRALIAEEPQHLSNQIWTPALLVGVGLPAYACEIAAAALTLGIARLSRGQNLEMVVAAGLAGSLLAAPYHHASDAIVLAGAFWLYMRVRPPLWHWPWLAFGAVSALLTPPWGPRPLLVFTVGWLLLMLWTAINNSRAATLGTRAIAANPD